MGWLAERLFVLIVACVVLWLVIVLSGAARADTYIDEQTPVGTSVQVPCTGTSSIVVTGGGKHAWTLLNQSAVDVFLCFGVTCTTTTGTRLQQNMSWNEQTYTGNVSCITAGSTATLARTVR